jgi:hypothetical protein
MINPCLVRLSPPESFEETNSERLWTRAEVRQQMGVSSRSTLNAYCNYLKIPRRLKFFSQAQYAQIMELRRWVLQGYAISDFLLKSEDQSDCA